MAGVKYKHIGTAIPIYGQAVRAPESGVASPGLRSLQMSRFATASAFFSMNSRRGST